MLDEKGRRVGWRVPDSERAAWDWMNDQHENHLGIYAKAGNVKKYEAKPLSALVEEIKPWVIDFNFGLERDLEAAYDADAEKVTRIILSIVQGCEAQRIHSPGGVLRSRLNDLRSSERATSDQ